VTRVFHGFVAVHFFLNGLLPVYIPVVLYQHGYNLAAIAGYISISAVGFLLALRLWQYIFLARGLWPIFIISFAAQACLIAVTLTLFRIDYLVVYVISALLYGAVNCLLWTSQRTLFIAVLRQKNTPCGLPPTGRLLGNFQIVTVLAIKLGLLVGAFLIAKNALLLVATLALGVAISSVIVLALIVPRSKLHAQQLLGQNAVPAVAHLGWKKMLGYRDLHHSRLMFYIDGLFLFAESFFWVFSLYLLSHEDIQQLSILLVTVGILLGFVFWLLKNRIDHIDPQKIYLTAVLCYSMSWVLRATMDVNYSLVITNFSILVIAFATAFFRLCFNKRMFDNAHAGAVLTYLLAKTYASQVGLMLMYGALALALYSGWLGALGLQGIYWCLAILALAYGVYKLKAS